MSDALAVQCPQCSATLKLKSRQSLGKRVKCPKCGNPFVLKAQQQPQSDDEWDDLADSGAHEFNAAGAAALPQRSASAGRGRGKKEKPRKPSRLVPILIAAFSVAAVAVGIAFLAMFLLPDGGNVLDAFEENSNRVDLSYLPDDTEVFIRIQLSEMWAAPMLSELVSQAAVQDMVKMMDAQTGLKPQDIESITVGLAGLSDSAKKAAAEAENGQPMALPGGLGVPGGNPALAGGMPLGPAALSEIRAVIVVRSAKDIDPQKLVAVANGAEAVAHQDRTYYRLAAGGAPDQLAAFCAIDAATVILGDEASVKQALDSGGKAKRRPEFDFVDPDHHLLLAAAPQDPSLFKDGNPLAAGMADGANEPAEATEDVPIQAASLGLDFAQTLAGQVLCQCGEESAANELKARAETSVEEYKLSVAEGRKSLPDQFRDTLLLAERVLNSVQLTARGPVFELTASVPKSSQRALEELPGALMALMMHQAMQAATAEALPEAADEDAAIEVEAQMPDKAAVEEFLRAQDSEPVDQAEPSDDLSPEPTAEDTPPQAEISPPETANTEPEVVQATAQEQTAEPSVPLAAGDSLPADWNIDLNVANRPAVDVLTELAQQNGLTVKHSRKAAGMSKQPVTLELSNVSPVEAIEAVSREAGLIPVYSPDVLTLETGPRTNAASFTGPFLVEVESLDEYPPYATGRMQLKIVALGLDAGMRAALETASRDCVVVEEIVGSDDGDLRDEAPTSPPSSGSTAFVRTVQIPLKNLLRPTTEIRSVKGYVALPTASEVTTIKIEQLSKGQSVKQGDIELKLVQAEPRSRLLFLRFEPTGVTAEQLHFAAYDAQGDVIPNQAAEAGGGELLLGRMPASIIATAVGNVRLSRYDFELGSLPLTSSDRMPESLEPLRLGGYDQPVSVDFVRMAVSSQGRKARFRATNHANKDIESMELVCVYRDASGNRMEEQTVTQQGTLNSRTGRRGLLAESSKRSEFDVLGLAPPSGAQDISVTVRKVRFADASQWSADGGAE